MSKEISPTAQNLVKNVFILHTAIRRGMEQLIHHADTVQGASVKSFMGYCESFLEFLHHHHDHEDEIFFPAMKEKFPEVAKLDADHKILLPLMAEMSKYCKDVIAGTAAWDKVAFVQNVKKLQGLLKPHLKFEQELFTPESLSAAADEQFYQKLFSTIKAAAQAAPGKTTQMSFFMTQMNDEEFQYFFGDVPFVPRYVVFPMFKMVNASFWAFSKNTGGLTD